MKGVIKFGKKGKLSPRFVGQYRIFSKKSNVVGPYRSLIKKSNMAYELDLPAE